jgi:HTH-type transcriptional regulator/antitoxin HigA
MINIKAFAADHPGTYIREELEERGWSQRDLSYILGRPEPSVNLILSGKRGITAEMAKALGEAFDISPDFFLNLQKMYDLSHAQEPDPGIAKRARFYWSSFPVREMIKRGWLEDTADPEKLEKEMANFFQVKSVEDMPRLSHAAKKTFYDEIPAVQLAWLFRVRQIAQSIQVQAFSERRLQEALSTLRELTSAPEEARRVPRTLVDCGIRYVIVETLAGAKIDGVTFWLNPNAPVIGMSLRYDRIDNFWFVLRHEIEHVLQRHGQEQEVIDAELEGDNIAYDATVSRAEKVANKAAAQFSVPIDALNGFIARKYPYISERDVLHFAKELKVHPGIVVGQIQNKTKDYRRFRKYLVNVRKYLLPNALVDGWGEIPEVK